MTDQSTETVFNNSEATPSLDASSPEVKQDVVPEENPFANRLAEIKSETGQQKYSDVESALASIKPAQEHISKLEEENAKIRAELEKRSTAEEILEQIKAKQDTPEATPPVEIDLSQIEELVESKVTGQLSAAEAQKVAQANVQSVIETMTAKFGDQNKAEEVYIAAAKESGFSVEQMNNLAATSPKAVLKLAGVDSPVATTPAPSTGTINTESLQPKVDQPSSKVPVGATAKDMASAWNAALPTS